MTSGLTQVTYALPEARFMNGQNGGADFRLSKQEGDVWVYRIEVSTMPFFATLWDFVQCNTFLLKAMPMR